MLVAEGAAAVAEATVDKEEAGAATFAGDELEVAGVAAFADVGEVAAPELKLADKAVFPPAPAALVVPVPALSLPAAGLAALAAEVEDAARSEDAPPAALVPAASGVVVETAWAVGAASAPVVA